MTTEMQLLLLKRTYDTIPNAQRGDLYGSHDTSFEQDDVEDEYQEESSVIDSVTAGDENTEDNRMNDIETTVQGKDSTAIEIDGATSTEANDEDDDGASIDDKSLDEHEEERCDNRLAADETYSDYSDDVTVQLPFMKKQSVYLPLGRMPAATYI